MMTLGSQNQDFQNLFHLKGTKAEVNEQNASHRGEKKYCMLLWKENILIFSRQQKPRNWLECRMPDKPIFAAGPPVVLGPLVEWGAAPLYSSSSSLYVWRDISATLLTDYRLSYSSCCVWRAETEGGHANSFLCTVSSDETVTLFGAVFPLVCLCLSGPSGRHGGRQGCRNGEWWVEKVKRSWPLDVFFESLRLICLQRSMLLASSHPWVACWQGRTG